MKALDGFNRIARYYDFIKYLVFGNAIHESKIHFIEGVSAAESILILGGGSGEILKPILQVNPACTIWYVEASSEMLLLAASRIPEGRRANIRFIHGTEDDLPADVVFDGIITSFFLDLFQTDHVLRIVRKLQSRMMPQGVWLVSDFVDGGRWWHRMLLSIMYRFFRITCDIEAKELPAWEEQLRLGGLETVKSRLFYGGFIRSCVWAKRIERV